MRRHSSTALAIDQGGEHHNGVPGIDAREIAECLDPVDVRPVDVEQDEIRFFKGREIEGRAAAAAWSTTVSPSDWSISETNSRMWTSSSTTTGLP